MVSANARSYYLPRNDQNIRKLHLSLLIHLQKATNKPKPFALPRDLKGLLTESPRVQRVIRFALGVVGLLALTTVQSSKISVEFEGFRMDCEIEYFRSS